jgi:2-haloacid dehalogenase
MAVRALVFDVFGTLVDWRSGVADAFRMMQVPGDAEELADAWRARYRPILAEVNNRARLWANFDELHLVTLEDLLTERGIDLPLEKRRRGPTFEPGSKRCGNSA